MTPAVLYTHDLEPITVINLPQWAYDMLAMKMTVQVPVHYEIGTPAFSPHARPGREAFKVVQITGELLLRNGKRTLLLFTHQDEDALMLRAAFLPGQRRELQREKRKSFAQGFIEAIEAMRP